MLVTTVTNINLQDLIIEGKLPFSPKFEGIIPENYSIDLLRDGVRTFVLAHKSLGGEMAFTIVDGDFNAPGTDRLFTEGDKEFIKSRYPNLPKAMYPYE